MLEFLTVTDTCDAAQATVGQALGFTVAVTGKQAGSVGAKRLEAAMEG